MAYRGDQADAAGVTDVHSLDDETVTDACVHRGLLSWVVETYLTPVSLTYHRVMTSLWVLLAICVGACLALMVYLVVRDRRRLPSGDDAAANRDATSAANRYAAERYGEQGTNVVRDQLHGGS